MAVMIDIQYIFIICLLWLVSAFILHYRFRTKPAEHGPKQTTSIFGQLPATPGALPIVGHLHHLIPHIYKGLHKLGSKYGPFISIRFGKVPVILLSNVKMANEIFKNNDLAFSNRSKSPFEDNLLFGSNSSFFNAKYGDYWKFMKKLSVQELLGASQIKRTRKLRLEEVMRLINKLLEKAERDGGVVDMSGEVLTLANNITCRMVMSARCAGEDNEAEQCRKLVTQSFDVATKLFFANMCGPVGKIGIWFMKNKIADVPNKYDELFERLLEEHEERARKEGADRDDKDLMDILLEVYHDENAEVKITRKQMKCYFLDLFTGGAVTTADGILWVLAILMDKPEVMKKVKEEIDRVVGNERLVDESDIHNLHYLQAVVKETQRLFPPVPCWDRICREDCRIGEYQIDKGTVVVVNAYSIMRDPEAWENPEEFRPERFLKKDGDEKDTNNMMQNSSLITFGGGRRMCPGTNLTFSMTHATVAALVQCFDWKVAGGEGAKVNLASRSIITMSLANPLMLRPVISSSTRNLLLNN